MVKRGETRPDGKMLARCDAGTAEPRVIGLFNKSISSRKFPAGPQGVQHIRETTRAPEVGEDGLQMTVKEDDIEVVQ